MLFRRGCRPCHPQRRRLRLTEAHPIYALGGCTDFASNDLRSCWVLPGDRGRPVVGGLHGKIGSPFGSQTLEGDLFEAFALCLIQHCHDDWNNFSFVTCTGWDDRVWSKPPPPGRTFGSELWFDSGCGQETEIHISLDSWIGSYADQRKTFAKDARGECFAFQWKWALAKVWKCILSCESHSLSWDRKSTQSFEWKDEVNFEAFEIDRSPSGHVSLLKHSQGFLREDYPALTPDDLGSMGDLTMKSDSNRFFGTRGKLVKSN